MKTALTVATVVCAALLFAGTAQAQDGQNGWYAARVGAVDAPAVAQFYENALGMHEVLKRGQEIMLNFGATDAAAKANKGAMLIVTKRMSDDVMDPTGHLLFTVADIAATVKAIKANGGMVRGEPRFIKQSGDTIGFATDPAGNQMELLQLPKN
jgi:predicted enzyme related to lactoylglutathione lyase